MVLLQASGSYDQIQASTSDGNVQDQQMTSSSSQSSDQSNASNQVQVLQPTNVARDHPLDTIIGDISRGVQLDQDWPHFMSTSHSCHPLNLRR